MTRAAVRLQSAHGSGTSGLDAADIDAAVTVEERAQRQPQAILAPAAAKSSVVRTALCVEPRQGRRIGEILDPSDTILIERQCIEAIDHPRQRHLV